MARSGARSLRDRRVVRASFEAPFDLVDDDGAVAALRPTPAHADQALALSDAFGEGFGRGAHGAIAFEVGLVFGAEALDDVVARGGVGGIVENERIAEDAVSAVDVDGDFAGAGLAGRAGALVAEADGTGGFHGALLEPSMPRASRTSAALAFESENSRSSWPGKGSKRWPEAFKGVKLTDIGRLLFRRACGSAAGGKRAGPFGPRRGASAREGAHLGGGGLLLDLGFGRGFVGLPVLAGQVLVGVDRAVGGGEQGVSLHRHVGGEFAGPLRLAFEADRGPVFGVAAVGGPGGRGAGLADLGGVEASRPDCGADEGPDDLEVHLGRLVVEGAFEGLGHPLEGARVLGADRVVVGDDEAEGGSDVFRDALVGAELEGHLEVRAWRVSRLGEDLERL